jgi:multidrug efflux pump subunit AcrA (membrane-fusion protein)
MGFRVLSAIVVTGALAVALWLCVAPFQVEEASNFPIAEVGQDEFVAVIRTRGQIQAGRSVPIYAPVAQDLRISWMAPTGEIVTEGQPMIRFDSSSAERDLVQRRAVLERADASLEQAIAEARISTEHDAREMIDATLNVEIAELRTADSEFVGRIEAERDLIDLGLAEQNLRQLEAEIEQRAVSSESRIASLGRQVEDAQAEVDVIERRMARMEILAPLTGFAIYSRNNSSLASALGGAQPQPFRVGDQVSGGMNLAVIPDLTSLMIDVTVEEIDRGRMHETDEVIIRVDALPELTIETELTQISPLAEMSLDRRGRSFHARAFLGESVDDRLRPGMNGNMDVVIERIPDAKTIPAQALFTRGGKPTVFVVEGEGFRAVEVEVLARNPDEIAVAGVDPGTRVTLVDPFAGSSGEAVPTIAGEE